MTCLFVLIDALGWSYVRDRDFFPEVLTFKTEVKTVLGFSCGAIPTILSGKLPNESGHWNLFYYDPANSPFRWLRPFRRLPSSVLNNRIVRRVVRLASQRFSRFGGYFQIYGVPVELLPYFDICEKDDIYRLGGVSGSIFETLHESGIRFQTYSYHQGPDEEIISTVRRDLKQRKYEFYFVYLSEMDAFLHRSCADNRGVDREVSRYERWVRDLYANALANGDEVALFVGSDHGMTPKREGYDLLSVVGNLGLKAPRDYLALYDSTMARFWCFNAAAQSKLVRRLQALSCGRVLTAEEKQHFGINFEDNRFGDVIFLMNPGILIEPSFMGTRAPDGMHGFDPEQDVCASAAFFATKAPSRRIRDLRDVHAVLVDWINAAQETPVAS